MNTLIKARTDDRLGNLSHHDQARILNWLAVFPLHKVRELVAQPRPDGFDFQTSSSALSRFQVKHGQDELLATRQELQATARNLNACSSGSTPFDQAALDMLEQKAFQVAMSPDSTLNTHKEIGDFLLRRARIRLQEQELQLKEKQLDLEARRVQVLEEKADLAGSEDRKHNHRTLTDDECQARFREILNLPPLEDNVIKSSAQPVVEAQPQIQNPQPAAEAVPPPQPAPPVRVKRVMPDYI